MVLALAPALDARVNVAFERNGERRAGPRFEFRVLASPSSSDAASEAELSIVSGRADPNGGGLEALRDGRWPESADSPRESFFFDAGTSGGRILLDLRRPLDVDRVNTYSWHTGARGPQVYTLWASDGKGEGFVARPEDGGDLTTLGWTKIATVDTRPEGDEPGGQYAVSIFDSDGAIGPYRYLLFDVGSTDPDDRFAHTFFSEIDVVATEPAPESETGAVLSFEAASGKYRFTIDTRGSPDLTGWARDKLAPVVVEWYPKIVELLPSEGYEAPESFSITIGDDIGGVASAGGTRIRCSGTWFRRNLEGEARGAVVHELVHVVQRYRSGRRRDDEGGERRRTRPPGWLVEGIPDYIRWFLYEPESRGAEITRRSFERARYDASYRVSANFLDWVTRTHDKELVKKLNAALRDGRYDEALWKEWTGFGLPELGERWKTAIAEKLGIETAKEEEPATREDGAEGTSAPSE